MVLRQLDLEKKLSKALCKMYIGIFVFDIHMYIYTL